MTVADFELANKFSKAELQDFSGIVDVSLSEEEEIVVDNKENVEGEIFILII